MRRRRSFDSKGFVGNVVVGVGKGDVVDDDVVVAGEEISFMLMVVLIFD